MSTYIGGRIIPKHAGTWDETAEYETLTVVLDEETGDSYISRKAVPAGTALDDEEYWAKSSDYSVQLKNIQDAVDVLEAQVTANVTASTDADADYAAEVVDARIDADGNTHDSLGAHIRDVGAQLNATDDLIYEDITGEVTEGSFVDARNGGVRTVSSTWTQTCYVSDLIAINPDAQKILYTGQAYNYIGVAGYDSSGTYVDAIIDVTEEDDDYVVYEDYELTIPDGVTQIRASSYGNELKIKAVTSAGALAEQINEINDEIDSMVWAGAKTAYILSGEITINVDYDEGTGDIQLTHSGNGYIFKSDGGADSKCDYTVITAEDEAAELNAVSKSARILALDDSTGKINIYTDKQFRALGENGYYIAAMWSNKFVNANINPGVSIVLNGTTYQAGDLLFQNSSAYNTYVESRYKDAMAEIAEEAVGTVEQPAGAKTAYMLNGEITINVDYDEGTGTIQLTHSGNGFLFKSDGGAASGSSYTVIKAEDEAADLNSVSKNGRILALDDSTGKINIYTDTQFRNLCENGYYIATMWSNKFVNARMNPSVSIVLNGTTYKAGDLFYENTSTYNTYVESRYQDAIDDAVEEALDSIDTESSLMDDITGEVTEGSYVDARSGTVKTAASSWTSTCYMTDLIPIMPEVQMIYYSGRVYNYIGVAGYDASGNFVSAILDLSGEDEDYGTYEDYELTIPGSVTQIRASSYGNELVIKAKTDTAALAEQVSELSSDFDSLVLSGAKTAFILNGEITINVDYTEGTGDIQLTHSGNGFIFKSDGGASSKCDYTVITAEDEAAELNSVSSAARILALDDSTKKINIYSDTQFRALGSDGYYIATMWSSRFVNAHINPSVTIILNGTTYKAGDLFYENSSYNTYVESRYQDAIDAAVDELETEEDSDGRGDIVSPSHWDCMEGRQLSVFYDCLSRHEDRKEMYRIQNSMSLYRNEYCLNYTPATDDEDFSITIARMNKSTMTVAESKAVTVKVHHPLSTSLTKNVCICGDSLVDNAYLAQEVWDMLDEDGDCVINHIGTRGGTGYEHEGRGSWSWATYIQGEESSNKSNAFWDSDNECLNFQKYCEDNGYEGIDYFLMGLGTNDVGLGSTTAKTETQIQAIITRAKTFIDALLSDEYGYPDCKIGIGLPGSAAYYSSYASWSTAIFRRNINTLNLAYIEAFDDGAYNENVTCFAYGLRTDRMHAFPYTESAVNDRFEETCITFTEATGSSSHPSKRGYQSWADGYYCQIRAWLTEDAAETEDAEEEETE